MQQKTKALPMGRWHKKTNESAETKEAFGVHFSELGPRMIPHPALSDDIAGEEVQLLNERLM